MLSKDICKKCCIEFTGNSDLPPGWQQYDEDRWNLDKSVWCPCYAGNSIMADYLKRGENPRSIYDVEGTCKYKAEQIVMNVQYDSGVNHGD
jgi:hypothetical protein